MRTRKIVELLLASLVFSTAIHSQEQNVQAPATARITPYANTNDGLKQFLQDMRLAAKDGNEATLTAMIKQTEVPDCDAWLHRMYESDKADSWMSLCEAKSLDARERDLRQLFSRIAKQDGKLTTRKVNDNPEPGHGLEWGWLGAIKEPLDIYWASWLPNGEPKDSGADPIGYFMFIDSAFRWDSLIQIAKVSQMKHAKIVLPKLVKQVDPVYPNEAAARNAVGVVRVHFVISSDGLVHNAHAISGEDLSEDGALRKAAEEAVMQWRYEPATLDGKSIPLDWTADITFVRNH